MMSLSPPLHSTARYGGRAGGTHPTGMLSCSMKDFTIIIVPRKNSFLWGNTRTQRKTGLKNRGRTGLCG